MTDTDMDTDSQRVARGAHHPRATTRQRCAGGAASNSCERRGGRGVTDVFDPCRVGAGLAVHRDRSHQHIQYTLVRPAGPRRAKLRPRAAEAARHCWLNIGREGERRPRRAGGGGPSPKAGRGRSSCITATSKGAASCVAAAIGARPHVDERGAVLPADGQALITRAAEARAAAGEVRVRVSECACVCACVFPRPCVCVSVCV